MTKDEARKRVLIARKQIDFSKEKQRVIAEILEKNILVGKMNIGLYYPLSYEIDLRELIDFFPTKNFYFPITKDDLKFVLYAKDTPLKRGNYKVMEPVGQPVDINNLDLIFIPCVAISIDHRRIGYGKGFYDRALKDYKKNKIGICPKQFQSLEVEMEKFDLLLDQSI